ncbi:MAG: tyrosine-protein phosphatase [Pseudomonadota bacterium]
MTGAPDQRVIAMTGIHNFRDYGGYAARGGRIRRGKLWRSGQHSYATADDLAIVRRLEISTVVDLRGDSERASAPCLRHPAFAGEVLFEPGETASAKGRAVHEEVASRVHTADDARVAMVRLYKTLPFRPVLVGTFRLYIQALASRKAPSLLHCFAGKDRTGLAAALIHTVLGVHPDDVMADYLLTNTAGGSEARIEAGARHVRAGFGRAMSDDAVRVLMGVRAEFLDEAFAVIRKTHGSTEVYARDVLGVTPEILAGLERNLIET